MTDYRVDAMVVLGYHSVDYSFSDFEDIVKETTNEARASLPEHMYVSLGKHQCGECGEPNPRGFYAANRIQFALRIKGIFENVEDAEFAAELFETHLREWIDKAPLEYEYIGELSEDLDKNIKETAFDASDIETEELDPMISVRADNDMDNTDSENFGDFITSPPEMDFDDVAGMDDLKEKLRTQVIDPIENPEKYEEYGLSVENGFLFYGPPGTGKTYISKALAGELDINYAGVKGSDLISRFVGAGTENVAELFEEARDNQPCMIFIDEIDAVASERTNAGQHQMQTQMVNQLLEEIGDINDSNSDIVVVGATNKPEKVDDAIKRSGRLTAEIEIDKPDADSRIAILDTHLDAPRADYLNLDDFAETTEGLNAADMEQVAIQAARNAMQRSDVVKAKDIETGIDQVQ